MKIEHSAKRVEGIKESVTVRKITEVMYGLQKHSRIAH